MSRIRRGITGRLARAVGLRRAGLAEDDPHGRLSFAQEGEDMILARIFEGQDRGFYVDVGAHHPQRFSNTYYFYLRGWRGINVDAAPGSMTLFEALRPRDINLEVPVAASRQVLTYYVFNEPALNSFSKEVSAKRDGFYGYRIISEERLETRTLADLLDEHLPAGTEIDFLSVDVEGLDYEVLSSNDWSRYRPRVLLVEDLDSRPLEDLADSALTVMLRRHGYRLTSKTVYTLIFSRADEGC
jgi:FkbM family methyltransferase